MGRNVFSITDDLMLTLQGPRGRVHRHWTISQPRASVAVTLRGKILAACGEGMSAVAARLLAGDEDVRAEVEGIDPTAKGATDTAIRLLRNAQAGRAIRGLAGGSIESLMIRDATGAEVPLRKPTVGMVEAATAIERVLLFGLREGGIRLRTDLLFGEVEVDGDSAVVSRPGLLWQLAFACDLRYRGGSEGDNGDAIAAARSDGFVAWVNAMDEFLYSPAEMEVLFAWCLIHTFRPF